MKVRIKNQEKITFEQLAKRRGCSIDELVKQTGVSSKADLDSWCEFVGVVPPIGDLFFAIDTQTPSSVNEQETIKEVISEPETTLEYTRTTKKQRRLALLQLKTTDETNNGFND